MSWLDKFFGKGYGLIQIAGVPLPPETVANFVSGVTGVDNPNLGRTDLTISAGGVSPAGSVGDIQINASPVFGALSGTNGQFVTRVSGAWVGGNTALSYGLLGSTIAANGLLRGASGTTLVAARNAANTGDVFAIGVDGSDNVEVGTGGAAITASVPIVGASSQSSVYGVHGTGIQAMADANQTPANTVYCFGTIRTTGAITANRTLTIPTATDGKSYRKIIQNACTGAFSIVVSTGAGTTQTIANGTTVEVLVDSNGVNPTAAAGGSSVTWASDLSSSSNTNQYVSSLSGLNGSGGVVNITGSTSLQWDVAATTPIINQATKASGTGAGMTIQAQTTSSGVGGSLDLKSGAGPSGAGNVNLSNGAALALQLVAGTLVAGDILCTGAGTVLQRLAKGSNFTFFGVNGSGVVGYNAVSTSFITPGTAGQMMTTTAGPVVTWGNTVSSLTTSYVTNSGADVYFGSDATGSANQAANCRFYPSSALLLGITNANYILCQSSSVVIRQATFLSGTVGGESALSTPFHWASATIAMSASVTATAAQYACPFLTCTGATTGNVLILPNTTSAIFWIRNTGSSMTVKVSGQTGVNINSSSRACVICNGTDYETYP